MYLKAEVFNQVGLPQVISGGGGGGVKTLLKEV